MCVGGNPKKTETPLKNVDFPTLTCSQPELNRNNREKSRLEENVENVVNTHTSESCCEREDSEEEDPFFSIYGEMDDDAFHYMMSVGGDWTYSTLLSDKVFLNDKWHTYTSLESCDFVGDYSRHGNESPGTSIQSAIEADFSGLSWLAGKSDEEIWGLTGHFDPYESEDNLLGSLFALEECQEDCSDDEAMGEPCHQNDTQMDTDSEYYFSADESLEESRGTSQSFFAGLEENSLFDDCLGSLQDQVLNKGMDIENEAIRERLLRLSEMEHCSHGEEIDALYFYDCNSAHFDTDRHIIDGNESNIFKGDDVGSVHIEAKEGLINTTGRDGLDPDCSRIPPLTYQSLLSCEDEDAQDDIWSILTDRLSYVSNDTRDKNPLFFEYDPHKILNAKKKYFDAAHKNIPLEKDGFYMCTKPPTYDAKVEHFNADNNNIPEDPDEFLHEDRYTRVEVLQPDTYNPCRDISTTYLWREYDDIPEGVSEINPLITTAYDREGRKMWFREGRFPMSVQGEAIGHLLDGTAIRVNTLIDSGCSKPLLNKKFYGKHKFLHMYPKFSIKPRGIKLANDEVVTVDEAVKFVMQFHGHVFEFIAYLVEITQDFDFIIGQKSMYELEATANFRNLSFNFLMRSLNLYVTEEIDLQPGQSRTYCFRLKDIPPNLPVEKDGTEVAIKLKSLRTDKLPITLVTVLFGDAVFIKVNNITKVPMFIPKGTMMGSLDARSLGYFHVEREILDKMLQDKCKFLSEAETEEYFTLLQQDHKEIMMAARTVYEQQQLQQKNTRLQKRIPTDEDDKQQDTNIVPNAKEDPYPWLEKDDPRRKMTDREILTTYVDLSDSDLTPKQKTSLYDLLLKYKKAFSLRDEIGNCPHMEVELELTDTTPFFIRPFPIKESDKDIVDKEMRKGCLLGILKKGMSSYSSPIMLIPRKLTGIPRIVTDFRHLNTRLVTLQPSIPLVRDAIQILGASGCEVLSLADLRDAYHTLRLSKKSQRYCGITPYYGSDSYLYQRLGMGLSVSPAIWQNFIQKVLSEIPNHRKHHLAIMDDCLVHSKKKDHLHHLIDLFKALIRNGLKMSPRKCKLFKTKLVYMGHQLLIEDKRPKITPMKTRIDAIQKLPAPSSPKGCKQFCGMVNFLSFFLPSLQEKLIPIYHLTKKGVPYYWGEEQEKAFNIIKKDLTSSPVLAMPDNEGHFVLVSDTSKIACGSALYQKQNGQYRLIAYYSKKLPDAVQRYSISELELTGMMANISAFKHLLRNADFTVYCDHSALVHIVRAKREPPTLRLMKLIENISEYKCTIKFLNGKEMHVADFLSRHPHESESPHEIIPIAFLLNEVRQHGSTTPEFKHYEYLNIFRCTDSGYDQSITDRLSVITRSMTKGLPKEVVPPMYPLKGDHKRPEHSKQGIIDVTNVPPAPAPPMIAPQEENPEREGRNMDEVDENPVIDEQAPPQPRMPVRIPIPNRGAQPPIPNFRQIAKPMGGVEPFPLVPQPQILHQHAGNLPQQQVQQPNFKYESLINPVPIDVQLRGRLPAFDVDQDFDLPTMIPTLEQMSKDPKPIFKKGEKFTIFRKHLPKQVELNKVIDMLSEKAIHDYNIPITVKELRAEYKNSPFFKDILTYITKGYSRYVGQAQRTFKMECDDYIVVNGVLFRLRYDRVDKGIPSLVLCIPEKYVPMILYQHHSPILAGHPGVLKLYTTIRKKYYFPGMFTLVRQYVTSCLECQSMKNKEGSPQIHYPRVPLDTRPMGRISMDIKDMPLSIFGYKHILVCVCEQTNWVRAIPLVNQEATTIADAMYFKIICEFGTPKVVICDEAPAFTSELMKAYFHALNIQPLYISPMNHGSNRSERYIRTMNSIMCKNLSEEGIRWPLYVAPSTWAMNTQVSQVIGFSPYEMIYHCEPPDLFSFDYKPDKTGLQVRTTLYMQLMQHRRMLMLKIIAEKKRYDAESRLVREIRKYPNAQGFAIGDLVLIYHEGGSILHSSSKKLTRNWIGPLRIQAILDDTHYLISDWSGQLLPKRFHINRLKPYSINLGRITKEGSLELVKNTRELYKRWHEIIEDENVDIRTKSVQTNNFDRIESS